MGRHIDPGQFADEGRIFADNLRIYAVVRQHDDPGYFLHFARVEKMRALSDHVLLQFFDNATLGDNRLFRGANRAVVKGFSGNDKFRRLGQIGAAFDEDRHIARADAERRFATAVSRPDRACRRCPG